MKIEYKQSFAIDKHELKIKKKGKSEIADIPAYFLFVTFFVSMVKEGIIKVLELNESELYEENISKEYQECEPDSFIISIVENLIKEDEDEEESEESDEDKKEDEDEKPSNPSDESVSSEPVNSESEQSNESNSEQGEAAEQVEAPKELSEDEKEFAMLEEKKLRLTNKEKKRHAELKEKLQG